MLDLHSITGRAQSRTVVSMSLRVMLGTYKQLKNVFNIQ